MASSSGVVTEDSTASALAPWYTATTVTVGGAIFGNCAIGSVGMEINPSSRITSEKTDAMMGRCRKKSTTEPSPGTEAAGLLGRRGRGDPIVERDDVPDDAAGHVLHRDGGVRAQGLTRRGFEHPQRVEYRE